MPYAQLLSTVPNRALEHWHILKWFCSDSLKFRPKRMQKKAAEAAFITDLIFIQSIIRDILLHSQRASWLLLNSTEDNKCSPVPDAEPSCVPV